MRNKGRTDIIPYHRSVMIDEVLQALQVKKGKCFIDATLGDGGHTIRIAQKGAYVIGIDWDEDAIRRTTERIQRKDVYVKDNIRIIRGNFAHLKTIVNKTGIQKIDGVFFDLGVSTYQIKKADRGFSFAKEGKLDMRMDKRISRDAFNIINTASEDELYEIFTRFAQEHDSRAIARTIIRTRSVAGSIKTTTQLAKIVAHVKRRYRTDLNPATRVFQAIRITVNEELLQLRKGLEEAASIVCKNGRLAVISFHSGEDRIVKVFLKNRQGFKPLTKRLIYPTKQEIQNNPRARSARMRVGIHL